MAKKKTWNKLFSEIADSHALVKRRRVKGTLLAWMNNKISETIKERDWIHRKARKSNSSQYWNTYRKLRNKVNFLVKSAKTKYYCDLFQDAKGNAKKFGMRSMKFVIATLLQKVSSALFLMEFSTLHLQ